MRDKPRLTPEFYEAHKQKLLAACKQGGAFEVK